VKHRLRRSRGRQEQVNLSRFKLFFRKNGSSLLEGFEPLYFGDRITVFGPAGAFVFSSAARSRLTLNGLPWRAGDRRLQVSGQGGRRQRRHA